MKIFAITLAIICASLIFTELFTIWRKFMMHRNERRLLHAGASPAGSDVRHGMILSPDGKGVIATESKSSSWYRKLD